MVLVSAGAGRNPLTVVVVEHFLKSIGQQLGAGRGAAAAEQIEREKDGPGFHAAINLHCTGFVAFLFTLLAARPEPRIIKERQASKDSQQGSSPCNRSRIST